MREAIIVSSIVAKNSIPILHSAAAMLKIAEMDYNGASSIFLRTLLDKKYALPYRVVDALVHHFLRYIHFAFMALSLALQEMAHAPYIEIYYWGTMDDWVDSVKM